MILNYTISRGLSQESTIKIYFPYLLEKKIFSLEQLQERKLIEEADNALTRELFAIGNVADTKPPAKKKSGRSLVKAQKR